MPNLLVFLGFIFTLGIFISLLIFAWPVILVLLIISAVVFAAVVVFAWIKTRESTSIEPEKTWSTTWEANVKEQEQKKKSVTESIADKPILRIESTPVQHVPILISDPEPNYKYDSVPPEYWDVNPIEYLDLNPPEELESERNSSGCLSCFVVVCTIIILTSVAIVSPEKGQLVNSVGISGQEFALSKSINDKALHSVDDPTFDFEASLTPEEIQHLTTGDGGISKFDKVKLFLDSKENSHAEDNPTPQQLYQLFIQSDPEDARIRILNIKPKYYHGIELELGSYHIEVTHDGYQSYLKWIELKNEGTIHRVVLEKKAASG